MKYEKEILGEWITKDCNDCLYISCTEEEQQQQDRGRPWLHECNKYHKAIYHRIQSVEHEPFLYPCYQCLQENGFKKVNKEERKLFYNKMKLYTKGR